MSDTVRRIRRLCGTLAACAESMDVLRAEHPVGRAVAPGAESDAPLWGGTVGAGPTKVNGASFWFDDIEPVYTELDELIRYASSDLCNSVFSDERVQSLAPVIHRVRAAYERDKELVQARNLVKAGDGPARLQRIIEQESYWALGEEIRRSLDGRSHILVAGSGPLPLTALCIGAALDVKVTCVERDQECYAIGRQLIAMSGLDDRFASVNADILDLMDFDDYDVIVGVVLLGVGTDRDQSSAKLAIAHHIIEHMSPGARMVLRDPHGLGRLLYAPVELGETDGVDVTRLVPEVGPHCPYRSGLVVAERHPPGAGHAY